jgi:hypothetical protein
LIRLLRPQKFRQHPVIAWLTHCQRQFAAVEPNYLATPTALDHLQVRRSEFRFRQGIL